MTFEVDAVVIGGDLRVEPDQGTLAVIPVGGGGEQKPDDGDEYQRPEDGSFQSHFHRP